MVKVGEVGVDPAKKITLEVAGIKLQPCSKIIFNCKEPIGSKWDGLRCLPIDS